MPYQAKAKTTANVTVTCEQCGKEYKYEHNFYAYGRRIDELEANALAKENMERVFDHYSRQITAGNISSIVENKPCPVCGAVQSWMAEPLRRKKSWKMGFIWAAAVFIMAIPISFILNAIFLGPVIEVLGVLLIYGLPLAVLFLVRSIVKKSYDPLKGKTASGKVNHPVIELHKGLMPETHLTL